MKKTMKKYRAEKGSGFNKFLRLLLVMALTFAYLYLIIIWEPSTYVSILGGNEIMSYVKIIATLILAGYVGVNLDINFFRVKKKSDIQLKNYEMWNKFFLHFAFMKTGSGSEKSQVLEVLNYLEDTELKQTLTDIYEENITLKDAHIQITEKYPYPQIKSFFAEAEDSLVKGADGNRLMQKTSINIDKYISDIKHYEEAKKNTYKMVYAIFVATFILTFVLKVGFTEVFIDFTNSYVGLAILVVYFIVLVKLIVRTKRAVNEPLVNFGGERDEETI